MKIVGNVETKAGDLVDIELDSSEVTITTTKGEDEAMRAAVKKILDGFRIGDQLSPDDFVDAILEVLGIEQ